MSPPRIFEAWGHRDEGERFAGGRWDPPHLVRWSAGAREGKALCGKGILPLRLELPGTARGLSVTVCPTCRRKAAPPPTLPAEVVDLTGARRRRDYRRGGWSR